MRYDIPYTPLNGTLRTRRFFCWFPKLMFNQIVWLESVHVQEQFNKDYGNYDMFNWQCWTVITEYNQGE